jgi:hypothetical protein
MAKRLATARPAISDDDRAVELRLAHPGQHEGREHRDARGVGQEERHEGDAELAGRDEAAQPQRQRADRAAGQRRRERGAEQEDDDVAAAVERVPGAGEPRQHPGSDPGFQRGADADAEIGQHVHLEGGVGLKEQREAVQELADEHSRQDARAEHDDGSDGDAGRRIDRADLGGADAEEQDDHAQHAVGDQDQQIEQQPGAGAARCSPLRREGLRQRHPPFRRP